MKGAQQEHEEGDEGAGGGGGGSLPGFAGLRCMSKVGFSNSKQPACCAYAIVSESALREGATY